MLLWVRIARVKRTRETTRFRIRPTGQSSMPGRIYDAVHNVVRATHAVTASCSHRRMCLCRCGRAWCVLAVQCVEVMVVVCEVKTVGKRETQPIAARPGVLAPKRESTQPRCSPSTYVRPRNVRMPRLAAWLRLGLEFSIL
jgi:hypothetical protein